MTIIDDTRYFPISSLPPLPPSDGTGCDHDHNPKSSNKKSKKNDDDVIVEEDYETLATQILENCIDEYENTDAGNLSDSLYIGRLGILVYLRIKLATSSSSSSSSSINGSEKQKSLLLSKARIEAERILQRAKKRSHSGRRFRVSLLEGPYVGAICMLVHIMTLSGDRHSAMQYANELISQLSTVCNSMDASECEVLYGRAGALQGIFYVRQVLKDTTFASHFVVTMATHILQVGLHTSQEYFKGSAKDAAIPLLWMWHDTAYLGAAHGVVGILQTLLYMTSQEWQQVERSSRGLEGILEKVQQTIDILISSPYYIYEGTGNFKSSLKLERKHHHHHGHHHGHEERDRLVHWCHGSPGLCMLLLRASEVFPRRSESYTKHAIQLAESVIYPRGVLQKGVGLCHGISGNAYIFLSLSRYPSQQRSEKASAAEASSSMSPSSSLIWIQRAEQYATFAIRNLSMLQFVPDCPFSLYEGLGGFVSLLLDLATLKRRKAIGEEKHTSPPPSPPPMFPLYEFNL